jgi:diguanylate cyclase (GGDEF)-like protein
LRSLIRHLLSVAKVGAPLKHALRVALASRDDEALRAAGRTLIASLLQRGDLVRVRVSGNTEDDTHYFALRDHAALLDLSPIYAGQPPAPEEKTDTSIPRIATQAELDGLAVPRDFESHDRLLNAMERAQDLSVTRIADTGVASLLQDVLELLKPTFANTALHIELFNSTDVPEPLLNIHHCPRSELPFWALTRVDGEAVWIPTWSELPPGLQRRIAPEGATDGFMAGVAVPLYPPAETVAEEDRGAIDEVGLLYVVQLEPTDRETLIRLAFRISRFVTNGWRQTDLMNHLVHIDTLTGVHNRAFFDEQIVNEIERAQRRDSTLVLLLGDIDHFKDVNDRYGHPAGDRVLKSVARELLRGLRRIDLVCRVGGEEFALVLPNTELSAARDIVTRIQVSIANLRLSDPDADEPLRVTISFGGATFPGSGDTPEELYRNADRMLYLSKQRGRNRCHFWNSGGDPILTLPRYNAPAD